MDNDDRGSFLQPGAPYPRKDMSNHGDYGKGHEATHEDLMELPGLTIRKPRKASAIVRHISILNLRIKPRSTPSQNGNALHCYKRPADTISAPFGLHPDRTQPLDAPAACKPGNQTRSGTREFVTRRSRPRFLHPSVILRARSAGPQPIPLESVRSTGE